MAVVREIPAPRHEIDIAEDYEASLAALGDLGYQPEADGVPALEEVEARIATNPALSAWLIDRADSGANDTLVVSRTIGGKQGIGIARSIHSFDPDAHSEGHVWSRLYGQADGSDNPYSGGDTGVIHDNNKQSNQFRSLKYMWDIAVLLGDETDPSTNKPAYTEGLVYTEQNVDQQRAALEAERAVAPEQDINLISATLGHIMTDAAILRVKGQDQRAGVARLVHYPDTPFGAFDRRVPRVRRRAGRLFFSFSDVDVSWGTVGVQRLVRVPESLET